MILFPHFPPSRSSQRRPIGLMIIGLSLLLPPAVAIPPLPALGQQAASQVEPGEPNSRATWAVLIGVDGYRHVRPLVHCNDDVRLLRRTLRGRGGLQAGQVLSLSEERDTQPPTRENILRKVPEFLAKAGPSDSVLLFFSGHGFRDAAGKTYLAPIDCRPEELENTAVPLATLRKHLQACRAAVKLLVIDACHAGGTRSAAGGSLKGLTSAELRKDLEEAAGIYTLASCGPQEASIVWTAKRNGLFTYWLNRGLEGAADANMDGRIDADELYRFVHRQVVATAPRLNHRQTPVQIVGPDVAGVPTVIALRPEPLMRTLNRMTELLHEQALRHGVNQVGVVEFICLAGGGEVLGGSIGPFGRLAAERLERELLHLADGAYQVVDHRRVRAAVKDVRVEQLGDTETVQRLSERIPDVDALLTGHFLPIFDRAQLRLTCRLLRPATGEVLASITGVIDIDAELRAFTGASGDVRIPPAPDPETDHRISLVAHLNEEAEARHPLLRDDFPFRVEVVSGDAAKQLHVLPDRPNDVFIAAREDEEFHVRVRNGTDGRVAMVLLLDGVNSRLDRQPIQHDDATKRGVVVEHTLPQEALGWVLRPQTTHGLEGFYSGRGEEATVQRFVFVSPPLGMAARLGFGENIGQITAIFYEERGIARGRREELKDGGIVIGGKDEERTHLPPPQPFRRGRVLATVTIRYVHEDSLKEGGPL